LTHKINKHARADNDLLDIWEYTFEECGADQADKYLDELDQHIRLLAKNPDLGSRRDHIREGYRVLFANRHAVYYIVSPSAVHIIPVLHSQMDPDRHL
jgi:toxin ParE1/3/4